MILTKKNDIDLIYYLGNELYVFAQLPRIGKYSSRHSEILNAPLNSDKQTNLSTDRELPRRV